MHMAPPEAGLDAPVDRHSSTRAQHVAYPCVIALDSVVCGRYGSFGNEVVFKEGEQRAFAAKLL